jgi:hypothetical protein
MLIPPPGLVLADQLADHGDRLVDRARDRRAEPHPLRHLGRLAPDHQQLRDVAAEGLEQGEDRVRLHAVGVDQDPRPVLHGLGGSPSRSGSITYTVPGASPRGAASTRIAAS